MPFNLQQSIDHLEKTPSLLASYLSGLPDLLINGNEGKGTWSPYDILGHLIVGEKTDWMVRIKIILSDSEDKRFEPFDRFLQLKEKKKSLETLLQEFSTLRKQNLKELRSLSLETDDFKRIGIHPEFGEVTIQQLISTWTVHDMVHIAQISRVIAKQYKEDIGPWINYLGSLK